MVGTVRFGDLHFVQTPQNKWKVDLAREQMSHILGAEPGQCFDIFSYADKQPDGSSKVTYLRQLNDQTLMIQRMMAYILNVFGIPFTETTANNLATFSS